MLLVPDELVVSAQTNWVYIGVMFGHEEKIMSLSRHIKPISYLKDNAQKSAQALQHDSEPYIITDNGEAAMVVQSVGEYERKENTLAMLQIIAQGEQDITATPNNLIYNAQR
jgi:PHD/YefM family antitoxin component YafN of YafNO toxin-antitoxin module